MRRSHIVSSNALIDRHTVTHVRTVAAQQAASGAAAAVDVSSAFAGSDDSVSVRVERGRIHLFRAPSIYRQANIPGWNIFFVGDTSHALRRRSGVPYPSNGAFIC